MIILLYKEYYTCFACLVDQYIIKFVNISWLWTILVKSMLFDIIFDRIFRILFRHCWWLFYILLQVNNLSNNAFWTNSRWYLGLEEVNMLANMLQIDDLIIAHFESTIYFNR